MRRPLSLVRGTSLTVSGVAKRGSGARIDLTGATLTWRVGPESLSDALLAKAGTVTNAARGEYVVTLAPSDTAGLTPAELWHQAEVTEADGTVTLILDGTLTLRRDLP